MSENELIVDMIDLLKEKMIKDYPNEIMKRDAHPKSLGLLKAEFIVCDDIDDSLKIGIFKNPKTYKSLIRISNSISEDDSKKDARGFAIKLLDVYGEKINESDEVNTQDFLFLSNETMPLGTVKLFHDSIYYLVKKNLALFGAKLILTGKGKILIELSKARKNHTSPLDISYFSTTPYKFGEKNVKYILLPTSNYKSELPKKLTKNYLTENMINHLKNNDASFDFCIQIQTNEKDMPTEDASINWYNKNSPYIKLATIKIKKQDFNTKNRIELAEDLSFSPAHSLKTHKPIGGINRARIKIYKVLSNFRHEKNNKKVFEPTINDFNNMV